MPVKVIEFVVPAVPVCNVTVWVESVNWVEIVDPVCFSWETVESVFFEIVVNCVELASAALKVEPFIKLFSVVSNFDVSISETVLVKYILLVESPLVTFEVLKAPVE